MLDSGRGGKRRVVSVADLTGTSVDPVWCTIEHGPGWPIHSCGFGEITAAAHSYDEGGSATSVELNDYGQGEPPTVSLNVFIGDIFSGKPFAGAEFTAAQARELAGMLVRAADVLDPPVKFASERARRLRNALVEMVIRYGDSQHRMGLASDDGTRLRRARAARRQFVAVQRLSAALRDVEVAR